MVIWDNPDQSRDHGDTLRAYLSTPDVRLRLVNLPAYSPDFNGDEAIWDWARDEVTANACLGTKAKVREKLGAFFHGLAQRTEEVKRRCRTVLQARAEALLASTPQLAVAQHVDPTSVLV
ncbi:MAG: transposase [Chloroflexi bacterium]|nr:transposase [Chloroflexota bacterium]